MNKLEQATLGAGCFWCVEAVFRRVEGVEKVVCGYSGGFSKQPDYQEVCSGKTGHAEVCQITFDPSRISYEQLLEIFWKTHDPTTKNRQGNDVGSQYRSIILYHDEEQRQLAQQYKAKLEGAKIWERPIQTEIVPLENFWPAEDYHQHYYDNNPSQSYCSLVITPKIQKLESLFESRLKPALRFRE